MGIFIMKEGKAKDKKADKKGDKKPRKDNNKEMIKEYTVNLHKRLFKMQFKKRGKRAIRELKKFAQTQMWVKDVRIDSELNHFIWKNGIRDVPNKVRIRVSKKKNQDEDAKEPFFCLVQHLDVEDFSGLRTETPKQQ
eukprot:TRINITY_DN100_c0_g1_i4.p1 TRINITY_DN100_c0_g1~~TRINITY_DN100_c0_g1_i4.p1  ORF type:complete len:150 (-),score=45.44 TRINITY_DN100_c0_g1_i4:125-535(-)